MAVLKHKKLTSKRNVNLTKNICAFVGLEGGDPVDIAAEDNGTVTIKKHAPKCRFCGDNASAVSVMGIEVCPSCAQRLAKEVTENA